MKLTPTQEMHLRNVKATNQALRRAKADVHTRAKILAQEEIQSYLTAMDLEVRLALESGVPKLQLRRDGMGTLDSKTLEDSLARTAGLVAVETDPLLGKYVLDRDELVVTIEGENAHFELITRPDGSLYLRNLTPLIIPGTTDENPVVSHVMGAGRDEATAWFLAELDVASAAPLG